MYRILTEWTWDPDVHQFNPRFQSAQWFQPELGTMGDAETTNQGPALKRCPWRGGTDIESNVEAMPQVA